MRELKRVLAQEDTVLFVGSGISLWSGLPSWPQLMEELAVFVEASGANADLVRAEAQRGDLLQAASYGFYKLTKPQIGDFIRKACRYGNAKPHEIHRKLVSLGPREKCEKRMVCRLMSIGRRKKVHTSHGVQRLMDIINKGRDRVRIEHDKRLWGSIESRRPHSKGQCQHVHHSEDSVADRLLGALDGPGAELSDESPPWPPVYLRALAVNPTGR